MNLQSHSGYLKVALIVVSLLIPQASIVAGDPPLFTWKTEVVDSAGHTGANSSLALDAAGYAHISYRDVDNRALKYAYQDDAGWHLETVDTAGDLGSWLDMAVDDTGGVHIAYTDTMYEPDHDLKYAYGDGASWQIQTIDTEYRVGGYASVALDSSRQPHIAYYDANWTALRYANYVGSGGNCGPGADWECVVVDNDQSVGEAAQVAIDSADHPHITYYRHYAGDLKYAYHDGSTWHVQTVDSSGNAGGSNSLVLDTADHPHVSYHVYDTGEIRYAYHDGTTWSYQTAANVGVPGGGANSLALDASGWPHIGYCDGVSGHPWYAYYDGTLWHYEVVDSLVTWCGSISLVLDASGLAHVGYYDVANGDLKYATRAPANRPPEITADHDAVAVDEGQTATNTGTVSDPDDDAVSLTASVGTFTNHGDGTWSWSFPTSDGPAESQMVTILADDGRGGTAQTAFELTVNNVPPTIESIAAPFDPVNVNDQPVSVEVTFSDPGVDDTHDVIWDWGDLTSDTQYGATSPASFSHTYGEPGVYAVQVTVTDDDGGSDTGVYEFIAICDPEGGFVTGGGWIWSEPGWCQLDELCAGAEGKANFGFVSKYKKGASVPTGNTEFNFKAGGLNFHLAAYEWLVVNQDGTNAQYKGAGTINGHLAPSGEAYKFMLWAKDLDPDGEDTFRIKIWYETAEGGEIVVYDNGFDQAIGGGNIVVHTSK